MVSTLTEAWEFPTTTEGETLALGLNPYSHQIVLVKKVKGVKVMESAVILGEPAFNALELVLTTTCNNTRRAFLGQQLTNSITNEIMQAMGLEGTRTR